jgi:hypothetical protein
MKFAATEGGTMRERSMDGVIGTAELMAKG